MKEKESRNTKRNETHRRENTKPHQEREKEAKNKHKTIKIRVAKFNNEQTHLQQ